MIRFEFVAYAPEDVRQLGLPTRATKGSAGYDFVCPKDCTIQPGQTVMISTFIKALMPEDMFLELHMRSSMGTQKGLEMACSGIIDSDYAGNPRNDGNILCAVRNVGSKAQTLHRGKRFMQGIFQHYETTDDDASTKTRRGGFGSTDPFGETAAGETGP